MQACGPHPATVKLFRMVTKRNRRQQADAPARPLLAGIYCRVSVSRSVESTSIELQERDSRKLADYRGIPVVDVYRDQGISGAKEDTRPEYLRMLADLASGRINTVICWKLDRLSRGGALPLLKLLESAAGAGGTVLSVVDSFDLSTLGGKVAVLVLSEVAAAERETIQLRSEWIAEERARKGLPNAGGSPKFGHNADGTEIPNQAVIIRRMYDQRMAGISLAQIAKKLNEDGIRASKGGLWSSNMVNLLLRQWRLSGFREYHEERIPDAFARILTEQEHLALLAVMDESAATQKHSRDAGEDTLLTRLLKCADCGKSMAFQFQTLRGKRVGRYKCSPRFKGVPRDQQNGCSQSIDQKSADEFVVAQGAAAHGTHLSPLAHSGEMTAEEVTQSLLAEITLVRRKQDEVDRAFREDEIEIDRWRPMVREFKDKLDMLGEQLKVAEEKAKAETAGIGPKVGEDAAEWFANASLEAKRAALRANLISVQCRPANGRNGTSRLQVQWRFGRNMAVGQAVEVDPFTEKAMYDESYAELLADQGKIAVTSLEEK